MKHKIHTLHELHISFNPLVYTPIAIMTFVWIKSCCHFTNVINQAHFSHSSHFSHLKCLRLQESMKPRFRTENCENITRRIPNQTHLAYIKWDQSCIKKDSKYVMWRISKYTYFASLKWRGPLSPHIKDQLHYRLTHKWPPVSGWRLYMLKLPKQHDRHAFKIWTARQIHRCKATNWTHSGRQK